MINNPIYGQIKYNCCLSNAFKLNLDNAPPSLPPPQMAVLFCPLPGQVRHLKWWLTKIFGDNVDIFHMYAEMGNDERTEMQLKFQDSQNPSVFITTPKVGRTCLNPTAANPCSNNSEILVIE
jgi:hypothetical protein